MAAEKDKDELLVVYCMVADKPDGERPRPAPPAPIKVQPTENDKIRSEKTENEDVKADRNRI